MKNDDAVFLEKLIVLIQASSLSQEDKNIWFNTLKDMPPQTWQAMYMTVTASPEDLEQATQLVHKKIAALKDKDDAAWNDILQQEKAELNTI